MPCRLVFALVFYAITLPAQELEQCLEALARSASNFAATAPGLTAQETLDQRGRRGFIDVLRGTKEAPKDIKIRIPDDFRVHHVVSTYGLAETGDAHVLHEIRTISSVDGRAVLSTPEARHTLTAGIPDEDDITKKRLLEDFERDELEGAVTDFGQLLLLFSTRNQSHYQFSLEGRREDLTVVSYHQTSGNQGVTEFRERGEQRQRTDGEIWFTTRDLLPVRITVVTEQRVSKKFTIRTEARVDYVPSRFGLVPSSVTQAQFLNADFMVENKLHYTDFQRPGVPEMLP